MNDLLFRSSRPDYIETTQVQARRPHPPYIVPVFQTGLH